MASISNEKGNVKHSWTQHRNKFIVIGVLLCCSLDIFASIFVFITYKTRRKNLRRKILTFSFVDSTFDILLFSIIRILVLLRFCVSISCGNSAVLRTLKSRKVTTMHIGCLQNFYVIVKILISVREKKMIVDKIWLMSCITFVSTVLFQISWKSLEYFRIKVNKTESNVNFLVLKDGNDARVSLLSDYDKQQDSERIVFGNKYPKRTNRFTSGNDNDQSPHFESDPDGINDINGHHKYTFDKTKDALKTFFRISGSDGVFLVLGFCIIILYCLVQTLIPICLGLIMKYLTIDKSREKVLKMVWYLALFSFLSAFTNATQKGFISYSFRKILYKLQRKLFSNSITLSATYFDQNGTVDVIKCITEDTNIIREQFEKNMIEIIIRSTKILTIFAIILVFSWKVAVIAFVSTSISLLLNESVESYLKLRVKSLKADLDKIDDLIKDVFNSVYTVKEFAAEEHELNRLEKFLDRFHSLNKRESLLEFCINSVQDFKDYFVLILIITYSSSLYLIHLLPLNSLITIVIFAVQVSLNIRSIKTHLIKPNEIQKLICNVARYLNIKNTPTANKGLSTIQTEIKGEIEFKKVSFAYPSSPNTYALKNLNLKIKRGEMVAIVGPKKSGKSAMLKLLLRLYEPTTGAILIDGISIGKYDRQFYHNKVRSVLNNAAIFKRSLRENIAYGVTIDEGKEIECASKLSSLDTCLSSFPDDYETLVDKDGGILSSQDSKEKLFLTRALIHNPGILLIDENDFTPETYEVLLDNVSGRTSLIVTQKLNVLMKSDKIIVLKNGEIVAIGRHVELVNKCALYDSIIKKQMIKLKNDDNKIKTHHFFNGKADSDSSPTFRLF